jgi:hypothetical protein
VTEIELGRGRTTLPAGLQAEAGDQRCVVRVDDVGFHVEAMESLNLPSWSATYTWETVQHLKIEPAEAGAAIIIGDDTPGLQRVELPNSSVAEVEEALARYRKPPDAT